MRRDLCSMKVKKPHLRNDKPLIQQHIAKMKREEGVLDRTTLVFFCLVLKGL